MNNKDWSLLLENARKNVKNKNPQIFINYLINYSYIEITFLQQVVQDGLLKPIKMNHDKSIANMLKVTGWEALIIKKRNFLDTSPHDWAKFTEPQITRGWEYFLNLGNPLIRCLAALKAAGFSQDLNPNEILNVDICIAELGRIDLLIIINCKDRRRLALCIEAKFDHVVTQEQLDEYYYQVSCKHKINTKKLRRFIIIAPKMRRDILKVVYNSQNSVAALSEWKFISWQSWLIDFDNALPEIEDDDDFRRFRRTVLERSRLEN